MCPCQSKIFFFQAEDGIRDGTVTGVQTCALPISPFRLMKLRTWVSCPWKLLTHAVICSRSEERRVGKSVDLGGRRSIKKKKDKRNAVACDADHDFMHNNDSPLVYCSLES